MNKKTLFLLSIGFLLILPLVSFAGPAEDMVNKVRAVFLVIGGSIVAIGWVIAGILWLTSGGSPERTGIAKKATTAAVIGTVLVILAGVAYGIIDDLLNSPFVPVP